jgi:hypothetical protein
MSVWGEKGAMLLLQEHVPFSLKSSFRENRVEFPSSAIPVPRWLASQQAFFCN